MRSGAIIPTDVAASLGDGLNNDALLLIRRRGPCLDFRPGPFAADTPPHTIINPADGFAWTVENTQWRVGQSNLLINAPFGGVDSHMVPTQET